jgi:hypothetical protein
MDGREGEDHLFKMIDDGTQPIATPEQDDGSQYLNDSGQGMEEEQPDVEAETGDDLALVKAGEPSSSKKTSRKTTSASTAESKKSKRGPAQVRWLAPP